ncbi:MAG: ABC transporter ATP-binding protein [Candidatus Thermoplasmatota archaeon]|nr:ABC transporter ATP-binding protein [Candidatus Thermoplasmatota archaeon]
MLPTLLRLGEYARDHWLKIAGVMVAVFISTGLGLVPPWLIRYGIDNMIMEEDLEGLWIIAVAMVGTALLKGVFDFIKSYVSEFIAQSIIHDIRVKLYEHLNKLSFSFYDESRTGDLMARITTDTDTLHRFLSRVSSFVSENILTIVGIMIIMLFWDYRLGLLYIMILPLMIFGMYMYSSRVRPMFRKVRKRFAKLTEMVQENFVGMEVIKLFGREERQKKRFDKQNQEYVDINIKASKVSARWMPYVHFLVGLSTALVVWYGGRLVIEGRISLGMMAGFLSYIAMLTRPVRQTGMMINLSSQAAAATERIFDVLDMSPEVKDSPDAQEIPLVEGKVEYRDVSFSYEQGKKVLKDINIEVDPGETVAVVGPTGSGKSTLLHLLPRFYDADEGKILIDGHDIKHVTIDSLRRQVGIVLQHTFLFGASIRENISYGRPDASMEEIIRCAKIAQIHDFIESLPLGYETPIGERGVDLSGGQKQRLAMARVLLTDPALLILDEPTSSVDVETEDRMEEAMKSVIEDRTTFVIAHRLWTVQNADKILLLKDGEIVERGDHDELLEEKDGFYRKIYSQVLKREDEDRGDAT